MQTVSLEQIIRNNIALAPTMNSQGWFPVLCKVCNDHGKKGLRAGFKFDTSGTVGYHCFNCGHKAKYDPVVSRKLSRAMEEVLRGFGLQEDVWAPALFSALISQEKYIDDSDTSNFNKKSIEPNVISLPAHFYLLQDAAPDDKWALIAMDYLERRQVDPTSYWFMLSSALNTGIKEIDKWKKRLIIPVYKDGKLIFYQGRDLTDTSNKKYESPATPKDCVLYGFERLFEPTDAPLYIVEGFFDALLIEGVAVLGNRLSEAHVEWLNRSRRRKVYIPDKFGGGQIGARDAIAQGWSVSLPDFGSDIKDINEAILKYGRLYVLSEIAQKIFEAREAEIVVGQYCEQKTSEEEVEKPPRKERRPK